MKLKNIFFLLYPIVLIGQNINLNNDFNNQLIRYSVLANEIDTKLSFNVRPLNVNSFSEILGNQYKTILSNASNTIQIKTLGIDYFIEYNSHHPYNRNNGTMIPNRGYQHIISPGVFIKLVLLLFNLSLNTTIVRIKNLMVFGKAIIQQYGQRDINYGIKLICQKDMA